MPAAHRIFIWLPSACSLAANNAGLVGSLDHDRARAVAKQHAGTAVVPVQDAREHFGADDQGHLGAAGLYEGIGRGQGIDKAAAYRLDIECGPALGAQIGLHQASRTGKHEVGSGSGDDDQVDVIGRSRRHFPGPPRGLGGQLAGRNAALGHVALAYARALDDPGIRRFDLPRRQIGGQFIIGYDAGGQIAARTLLFWHKA